MNLGPNSVATMAQVASLLMVSQNQVYMWHRRRARNGFPEAIACVIAHYGVYKGSGRKRGPMWDINEVVRWYGNYQPSPGGAPKGNQHAKGRGKRQAEESGLSIHS
jgi:hypothetical protein